jgi:hypothetical protein
VAALTGWRSGALGVGLLAYVFWIVPELLAVIRAAAEHDGCLMAADALDDDGMICRQIGIGADSSGAGQLLGLGNAVAAALIYYALAVAPRR